MFGLLSKERWLLLVLMALSGCACKKQEDASPAVRGNVITAEKKGITSETKPYLEQGDLQEIRKHGKLRILLPKRKKNPLLIRDGFTPDLEHRLAEQFARSLDLEPESVFVEAYSNLLLWLRQGKGDLVAASLAVTPERRQQAIFSKPIALVREQVVTRSSDPSLEKPDDLAGRRLAVRRSSSYWQTLVVWKKRIPGIQLQAAPEQLDTEQILHRVSEGEYDLTLADSNLAGAVLQYMPNLKIAFDLSSDKPVAWAVRAGATHLRNALDEFLGGVDLFRFRDRKTRNDLSGIKKRGLLRVLTRNTAATYFLWRGELMGFEYELVRRFAKQHDLHVKIVVPPSNRLLIPWLLAGKGDVIAAAMTITEERKRRGVAFSRPYAYATESVVARAKDKKLSGPVDLKGRTLVVRKNSSYWKTLEKLKGQGIDFQLVAAAEELNTENIIDKVAEGIYDLSVADSRILNIELCHRDDIRAAFSISDKRAYGWGVRSDNPELLDAIDAFFNREYQGLFYNMTYNKYFRNKRNIHKHQQLRTMRTGRISPYDDLFRKFADLFGFDWRLIAAQARIESRIDPRARSWVGAKGLMQIMPHTAEELGFEDVTDPAQGIHAGVKYLAQLRSRFASSLSVRDRNNFALASYNIGFGHVLDARRLAAGEGLSADRWSGNVEKAMLKLSLPRYARKARHGYCRGKEAVDYVRRIRNHYRAYVRATQR